MDETSFSRMHLTVSKEREQKSIKSIDQMNLICHFNVKKRPLQMSMSLVVSTGSHLDLIPPVPVSQRLLENLSRVGMEITAEEIRVLNRLGICGICSVVGVILGVIC